MSAPAVLAQGLTRHYGRVKAVDRAEVRVERGEIYGFLGLNGAGKSTTIRMMLGMVKPTAGRVELLGERISAGTNALWRRVGHLVESATGYPDLTVRQDLEVARLYLGMDDRAAPGRVIERLGLAAYADRKVKTLSTGNLQRLALARALMHGPELLVLDEPANGLDPAGVVEVRELLRGLAREQGTTVFMSSHILAEVDRLATRIGVIHHGRIIEELDADELEARRRRRLEVGSREPEQARSTLTAAGYERIEQGADGVLELYDPRALERPEDAAAALVKAGVALTRLAIAQEDLEEHFLRLLRESEEAGQ